MAYKQSYECTPVQAGIVICYAFEAMDVEWSTSRAEELPKRSKKL